MSLDPILSAAPMVQLHIFAALLSALLLPLTLFRKRRDRLHKLAGYVWLLAMIATAGSSFWISEIRLVGRFSPIHLLSVLVLVNTVWALIEVRRGNIRAHERILKNTAFWALGVAGLFTLLPGRLMNEALFGGASVAGFSAAFVIGAVLVARNGFPAGFREIGRS